jgi:hypothetical protein
MMDIRAAAYRLPLRAVVVYLLFVFASLLSAMLGNELLLLPWPHLATLPLQHFNIGQSWWSVVGMQLVGVGIVLGGALLTRRLFGGHVQSWVAAGLVVVLSLGFVTLALFGIAFTMGWPIAV